ncbi:hypothetical protein [Acinetobacter sp. SA01]|uniref:hypothetical protein n=1 Tax=Acinetobacter sp. SA01 TaxID=1862567 RepID=UPI00140A4DA8|nr:hypothetical protein [Acinetobacter sp. SA01]
MNIFSELCSFDTPANLFLNKSIRTYSAPDFSVMIKDLSLLGWTHEKIAFVLPVSGASTISEWSHGSLMNFDNGNAFIELWKHLTDKTEKEMPRINRHHIAG